MLLHSTSHVVGTERGRLASARRGWLPLTLIPQSSSCNQLRFRATVPKPQRTTGSPAWRRALPCNQSDCATNARRTASNRLQAWRESRRITAGISPHHTVTVSKNTCTFETMTGAKAMRGTGSKKREMGQNADSGSDWVVNLRNPAPWHYGTLCVEDFGLINSMEKGGMWGWVFCIFCFVLICCWKIITLHLLKFYTPNASPG